MSAVPTPSMGMRADEPHPHGFYSTNSLGDGWVGKKGCIKTKCTQEGTPE
jgi:hypothetical protein